MKTADELFDGSNAHLLDDSAVDPLVKPLTLHDVRMWWHKKRSDIQDDDAINFLFAEVARVDTENSKMKELLRDIYRVCGASSRASHREQTAIFQRMREALGIPGVCRWGAPHLVNDIMVQAIGCRPGETTVSANQSSCPFCGGYVVTV